MDENLNIANQIIDSLSENDKLKRKHANFWNYHKKNSKELGIFSEVFNRIESDFMQKITGWGLCEFDPPDIFFKLADGNLVGVEITELVNEQAINYQIKQDQKYNDEVTKFDYGLAVIKLREILESKEQKVSKCNCNYQSLVLLIHTDESLLNSEIFDGKGKQIFSQGSTTFNSVYLLFSYEPKKQENPLIRLL